MISFFKLIFLLGTILDLQDYHRDDTELPYTQYQYPVWFYKFQVSPYISITILITSYGGYILSM